MLYKDIESRKEKIRRFIRNNPKTTSKEIKKKLHIKIEKVYKNGMAEAFKDAGVKPSRNFRKKTNEEKRKIIIKYIKNNHKATGHMIRKDTKINFSILFKSITEAFKEANVKYPREIFKRFSEEKKRKIVGMVKKNPLVTITEIRKELRVDPYNLFNNFKDIYKQANINNVGGLEKRRSKKRERVIIFIKNNHLATQREINKKCKTHVQELFKKGIFEAYEKAGITFPYERLKLYGAALKNIKKRAKNFEDKIAIKLLGYGKVNRLVKTKRGVADIVLERKGKKAVIEIKDYKAKEISISQVNQLNKYLEDCNCNLGILISHKKPKKDKFLIGKNKIFVLENSELTKIPELIEGTVG